MEATNYYLKNLESGKLNIHTTKAFYDPLLPEKKQYFKQYCLWSNKQQCWISKGKAENCIYLKNRLKEMGFTEAGTVGERLPFKEQVAREQERAGLRAARADERAEKAETRSEQLYNNAKDMASVIPFGQPILVGHYSERRDRNYRARIDNKFRQSFQEQDKANYYEQKAETASETAAGAKYSNPRYLTNRIKECRKNIRIIERRLKGKLYPNSPEKEISQENKNYYNSRLVEETEKLDFFIGHMKKIDPEWTLEKSKLSKGKVANQQKPKGL
jgi:hypothetical protein